MSKFQDLSVFLTNTYVSAAEELRAVRVQRLGITGKWLCTNVTSISNAQHPKSKKWLQSPSQVVSKSALTSELLHDYLHYLSPDIQFLHYKYLIFLYLSNKAKIKRSNWCTTRIVIFSINCSRRTRSACFSWQIIVWASWATHTSLTIPYRSIFRALRYTFSSIKKRISYRTITTLGYRVEDLISNASNTFWHFCIPNSRRITSYTLIICVNVWSIWRACARACCKIIVERCWASHAT